MKKFSYTILKLILSLVFLFLSWITFLSFQSLDIELKNNHSNLALAGSLSFGLCLFGFIIDLKRTYVFAHEFAHWFFAKLCFRKTGKFNIGKNGGSVEIQNPNLLITLAPYFFPTYTFFWLPSYFFFKYLFRPTDWNMPIFFTGIGLSFAFHLAMTIKALRQEQSDLKRYGLPLSSTTILLSNLLIIYFSLHLIQLSVGHGSNFLLTTLLDNSERIVELFKEHVLSVTF